MLTDTFQQAEFAADLPRVQGKEDVRYRYVGFSFAKRTSPFLDASLLRLAACPEAGNKRLPRHHVAALRSIAGMLKPLLAGA